jgi:hypothetical protein
LFAPYVATISWSYGQLTLGVTGSLNYGFHVNHMPHWANWQGGSTAFGTPLHPTKQLLSDLPLYEFGAPFRTTYPPYNNMAYWYQGSKDFFNQKLQIIAVARTFYFLARIVKANPFLFALALALLAVSLKRPWRMPFQRAARLVWPLLLPAILGLAIYLAVNVEDRYLSPFCLIFSLLPLLPLLDPALSSRRLLATSLLAIYTSGAAVELAAIDGPAFRAAINRADYHRDPQWKLATALSAYGLKRGDAVALVDDTNPAYRCHWAYISGLRIVAEFGSRPWRLAPWERTRFDHLPADPADEDYGFFFWRRLTPQKRARVIEAFRNSGARAILSLSGPESTVEPGWRHIAGTEAWIYNLAPKSRAGRI